MRTKKKMITIRLVGEDEDVEFKRVDVNPKIDANDLQKLVEEWTKIPPGFQDIRFNGTEVSYSERPIKGIKTGEELFVKHTELSCWNEYKNCVELMKKSRSDKVALAKEAAKHHTRLKESGFFNVYAQFSNFRRQNHTKVAAWTDEDVVMICKATEEYFRNLHDERRGNEDSEFKIYFEERPAEVGGRPASTIAFVQIHGEDVFTKFNIKCHHSGPEGSSSDQEPDVSEFYCYKLLASIGVAPESHFISPSMSTGTKTSTYVATEWKDELELLETVIEENSLTADVVVQLVVLRVLLSIDDLHEQNCGRWKGTQDVAIVDFAPTDQCGVPAGIKDALLRTFPNKYWKTQWSDIKKEYDDDTWLRMAKKYLDKWDLENKLDLAKEQFDPTRGILKDLEIGFKKRQDRESPTDQLNNYIDVIRENLEKAEILFNSLV
ncbi:hypothetical protein CAEBREN_03594 [Caenorhabditis brenneri]|uniref:Ubiquitin-like domain-containing protein n=1 Tax=Caenorhabditis brenneri TaxID=135651 RepID=G0P5U6_CAEBE|nr:hypothetical protein CAEBREN_03594 [Caenorhabditis brenneri]